MKKIPSWLALSPLLVFLLLYLVTSLVLDDFYKMPITVAFMVSAVYAVCITRGYPLEERVRIFSGGAGNPKMMMMMWIFILAGAFAQAAKGMGAVDATVNLTLHVLPASMLLPGLFLAACFISLSIGTSVGTIVALTPVAVGIAQQTGGVLPLVVAAVVGGAFFGDNLSFISDTTVIATQTQGCRMKDKFLVNFRIVFPAALAVLLLYVVLGSGIRAPQHLPAVEWLKVIPYLAVLLGAVCGMHVMLVLAVGILLTGAVGCLGGYYSMWDWIGSMGSGMLGMGELIIVTLLAGGMLELIRENGGIDWLTGMLTRRVRGKRGAELCIASLVTLADVCTANNTVAIITIGPIARNIAERFGVDPRKSASILDTFSCFAQGLIPYGAQLLMAAGLASIAPTEILIYLYYPLAIGLFALLAILLRFPRRYS